MDEQVDIVKLARKANLAIKEALKNKNGSAVAAMYSLMQNNAVVDDDTARRFAAKVSSCHESFGEKDWCVGMQTAPGDFVKYGGYTFIYSGTESMLHVNQAAHPGAIGISYWQIIPETKEDWKIWPDVPDVACSVLQGESWWNTDGTKLYTWNGSDNPKCVTAPSDNISEWSSKLVEVFE